MKTASNHGRSALACLTRRQVLQAGAAGAAAIMAGSKSGAAGAPAVHKGKKPNILFIITDQQGLDTISANGCGDVCTPALDHLARRGLSFDESYSTNPLCSPARSSLFTGRMPSETGVIVNGRPIRSDIPNLGQWLGRHGYECIYTGKWHLPGSFQAEVPGFKSIPTGLNGHGMTGDSAVSRACQGYLQNRTGSDPFLLVASFLQPHDICQWVSMHRGIKDTLPYAEIADRLPQLPSNFHYDAREPVQLKKRRITAYTGQHGQFSWSERMWRYYLWSYYRHVEMVDAEIGRVLEAMEESGQAGNTLIISTADHGEGRGRHQMVLKNYLYDEAAKVPLIVSWPGHILEGKRNATNLVSGLDIISTVCDYAGIPAPGKVLGCSLRPLLEGGSGLKRTFVAGEVQVTGRMIRTPGYKYVRYDSDPVEQLFDMQADPGETKNLAGESKHASVLADHQKLLKEWETRLDVDEGAREQREKAVSG